MSNTSNNSNPFVRGYLNLRVVQTHGTSTPCFGGVGRRCLVGTVWRTVSKHQPQPAR